MKISYTLDVCPKCGSSNIDRDDYGLDNLCMYYPCTCNDCGQKFNEIYPFESPYVEYWDDENADENYI